MFVRMTKLRPSTESRIESHCSGGLGELRRYAAVHRAHHARAPRTMQKLIRECDGKKLMAKFLPRGMATGKAASVKTLADLDTLPTAEPWLLTSKLVVKPDQCARRARAPGPRASHAAGCLVGPRDPAAFRRAPSARPLINHHPPPLTRARSGAQADQAPRQERPR